MVSRRRVVNSAKDALAEPGGCGCDCHKNQFIQLGDPAVLKRTINFIGVINDDSISKCLSVVRRLIIRDSQSPIFLVLTSPGGSAISALSFYDTITKVWQANLVVVGSGDISSAAVVVMAAGSTRLFTSNTRVFLHDPFLVGGFGQITEDDLRVSTEGLKWAKERYQGVLIERSQGKLNEKSLGLLMKKNTFLTAEHAGKKYGLADGVIG